MAKWETNVKKIKGFLRDNGMTYADLAGHLGLSEPSIQNKLDGKTEFKASEMVATANLLGESPLIFFTPEFNENLNVVR